jgi:hypothetical protein
MIKLKKILHLGFNTHEQYVQCTQNYYWSASYFKVEAKWQAVQKE